MRRSATRGQSSRRQNRHRKKTSEEVQQEFTREFSQLVERVFAERRKTGQIDMEAVEMAFRAGGHRACAAALGHLLQSQPPSAREISCPCGQHARYKEMRNKQVLTVVGPIEFARPYYLCPSCQKGQSPKDLELDIEGTGFSPGVRRMMAVVGSDCSFQHGREQLEVLAGLEVTTKAVERQAEAIGADIATREQVEMQRALQLDLPIIIGPAVEVMYIEPDGTQLMMVKNETEGRAGRVEGESARTREVKLGCVFTQTRGG